MRCLEVLHQSLHTTGKSIAETMVMMPPIESTARREFDTVSAVPSAAPVVPWMRNINSGSRRGRERTEKRAPRVRARAMIAATMVVMTQAVMATGLIYALGSKDSVVSYPSFFPLFLTLATGDIGFHRYVSLSLLP